MKIYQATLELTFQNGEQFVTFEVDKSIDLDILKNCQNIKRQIQEKNPYLRDIKDRAGLNINYQNNDLDIAYPIQIKDFNYKLDEYFRDTDDIVLDIYGEWCRNLISINFSLLIRSIGSIPGKNIDLILFFPLGVVIKDIHKIKEVLIPKPPFRPNRNNLFLESLHKVDETEKIEMESKPKSAIFDIYPGKKEEDIFECVHLKLGDIKHHMHRVNSDVVIEFNNFEEMKNFKIEYIMTAENIVNKIEGELNVVIKSIVT